MDSVGCVVHVCITIIITEEITNLRGGGEDTGEAVGRGRSQNDGNTAQKKFSKEIKYKI